MMKIAQITDLHVGRENEYPSGVDVRANFLALLDGVRRFRPDKLVVSGDLCAKSADQAVYDWIKEKLDALQVPYEVISGNHDDPEALARSFGRGADLTGRELFFLRQWDEWPVFFLDTTNGALSARQQEWLRRRLALTEHPVLVFMHHPPAFAGVPHMDENYPLQNREIVQNIFFRCEQPVYIFAGHFHVEKSIGLRNIQVNITPSGYFQIDFHQQQFAIDHYRVALREIVLDGAAIRHSVVYV